MMKKKDPAVGQEFVHCTLSSSLKPVCISSILGKKCVDSILGTKETKVNLIRVILIFCISVWRLDLS